MISIVVLTKNNEATLKRTLDSVKSFKEVIVLDSGSSDRTEEIAKSYENVKWHKREFLGFGPMRQLAQQLASNDWILSLDSDEALSLELVAHVKKLSLDSPCIYSVPRHNYFNGKWIKWCGWYPDRQLRLYNRSKTSFCSSLVHEKVVAKDLPVIRLKSPIFHYSYISMEDFLSKMQLYSSLFAKERAGKQKSSIFHALFHGGYAFFKSYVLQRGFLGGKEGLIISLYNTHTTYYKYLKLMQENRGGFEWKKSKQKPKKPKKN